MYSYLNFALVQRATPHWGLPLVASLLSRQDLSGLPGRDDLSGHRH